MPNLPSPMTAQEVLDREFPPIRSRLLDLAAMLDRVDRAPGDADPVTFKTIEEAIQLLLENENSNRAERIQLLFSREFIADWRERFAAGAHAAEGENQD